MTIPNLSLYDHNIMYSRTTQDLASGLHKNDLNVKCIHNHVTSEKINRTMSSIADQKFRKCKDNPNLCIFFNGLSQVVP